MTMIRWKKLPSWTAPYCFALIQSGLTCAIAAAIANRSIIAQRVFFEQWCTSWLLAWVTMIPVVLLAAKPIHRIITLIVKPAMSD